MVDIKPTRVREQQVRSDITREAERDTILTELRHGDIFKVLSKTKAFKVADFTDFFAQQGQGLRQLFQESEVKSVYAQIPAPEDRQHQFSVHHRGVTVTPEEAAFLNQELMGAAERSGTGERMGPKAARIRSASAIDEDGDGTGGTQDLSEVQTMAEGTLAEWQQFMDDTWEVILDSQMTQNYQSKMAEVKAETDRIIALVKQGTLTPEFALIALAKVNQTKNGCLMTWLGKKAYHVNESLNRIANDLKSKGLYDAGSLQVAQAKTRDGAYQLNLLTTDMQKVMQDSASVMEQVKTMIDQMAQTKRQIVSNIAVR